DRPVGPRASAPPKSVRVCQIGTGRLWIGQDVTNPFAKDVLLSDFDYRPRATAELADVCHESRNLGIECQKNRRTTSPRSTRQRGTKSRSRRGSRSSVTWRKWPSHG